jgi:hypothetical protein
MVLKRISISGKMASGKTTTSDYLMQRYGYQRVSFATPIKNIVSWFREFGKAPSEKPEDDLAELNTLFRYLVQVNLENYVYASKCYDVLMEEIFPKYYEMDWSVEKSDQWRQLLQEIGDGLRKKVNSRIWMDYLVASLEDDGLYICDDMRYQNEYQVMADSGFSCIRLHISPEIQAKRIADLYGSIDPKRLAHPSETDLDEAAFAYVVDSDQELAKVLHDVVVITEGSESKE